MVKLLQSNLGTDYERSIHTLFRFPHNKLFINSNNCFFQPLLLGFPLELISFYLCSELTESFMLPTFLPMVALLILYKFEEVQFVYHCKKCQVIYMESTGKRRRILQMAHTCLQINYSSTVPLTYSEGGSCFSNT